MKKSNKGLSDNENLAAFFFGSAPFTSQSKDTPVNQDYDKGPEW